MSEFVVALHPGQAAIHNSPARFKVVAAGRRFGKSYLAAATLGIETLRPENDRDYKLSIEHGVYYIAPTFDQAKRVMWPKLRTQLGYEKNGGLIVNENTNDGWIELVNHRRLYIKGADNPDSLRGLGLSYVVLDEYADMKPNVWSEIIEPALMDVEGSALFIGCVTEDTLILGEQGLEEIGKSPEGYTYENKNLYGLGGWHKAENRYGNPKLPTKKLITKAGLELEATPNHKIWTPDGWRRLDSLSIGDKLYIQYDQQVYGNEKTSDDWAYFLGLYLAEGCAESDRYRVIISSGDDEIHEWLASTYGFSRYDKFHSRLNSKEFFSSLREWYPDAGKVRAPNKALSDRCLRLAKENLQSLLSGYFDGDGTAHKHKKAVACTTSSHKLSKQLQILLLNLGMRAARSKHVTPPTERVKVPSLVHRISLDGDSAVTFARNVGFRLRRKQMRTEAWEYGTGHQYWFDREDFGKLTGTDGYLSRVNKITRTTLDRVDTTGRYDKKLIADEVLEIRDGEAETFDFCIPDTHSYFSNGLISHNTPKGKNHFYQLFMKALSYRYNPETEPYPEYEAFHFKSLDNPFLNERELKRMMESDNRPVDVIRQEIEASFISGGGRVLRPDNFAVIPEMPGIGINRDGSNYVISAEDGHFYVTVDLAGFKKQEGNKMLRTDESVIAITYVNRDSWYVVEVQHGHWDVRETALRIVRTCAKYPGCRLGIEKGALANAIGPYLNDYMREFSRYITPEPLAHNNTKKADRISWALQGRSERDKIKLLKGDWNSYFLDQVSDFPDPLAHDDALDAVSYVDQMASISYVNSEDVEEWAPLDLDSGY